MTSEADLVVNGESVLREQRRGGSLRLTKLIAVRLGVSLGLLVAAVVVLSLAALMYLQRAEQAANAISMTDAVAAGAAADISVLLERHRRLLEAAMTDRDTTQLDRRRQSTERIGTLISTLLRNNSDTAVRRLSADFESLVASSRRAFFAVRHVDYDQAQTFTERYTHVSDRLQRTVRESRDASLRDASQMVIMLKRRGETLKLVILSVAIPALFVLGPLCLLIVGSVIQRINTLTDSMKRVALNNTNVTVTAIDDGDEIGEMARALDVFKKNAEMLVGNAREIKRLNEWFDIALNNMARGLSMFDADGRLVVCNRQYLDLYQLPEHLGTPGTRLSEIAAYWTKTSGAASQLDASDMDAWSDDQRRQIALGKPFEHRPTLPDGRSVVVHVQPLANGGWVDVHEDITEADTVKRRISELASSDTLTGLANRRQFMSTLDEWFERVISGRTMAVLWFDLDRFKAVNDTYGHPVGDSLLRIVAERLRHTVRADDLVARLGGDEFAIIIETTGDTIATAEAIGKRVIAALSQPFAIDGHSISIGASVGVAMAPVHGTTSDALLQNADIALYRAKTSGRGVVVPYSTELEQTIKSRRQLESDLRRAVAHGELMLHYQPIVDCGTGHVTSCEALMRWNNREKGMISPAVFIPMAEELGLIGTIGAWALRQACQDAMTWPPNIKVAVNLSASQFASRDLLAATDAALQASRLPPSRLEVEVTETLLLKDDAHTLEILTTLSQLGITIALDDFGTGFASLSYLRRFPFDKIKIDQTFIRDMRDGTDSATIVRAVVDLAHTLGMTTVAEGIETADQRDAVVLSGCDAIQGYFFSRPVPASDIGDVIAACSSQRSCAA